MHIIPKFLPIAAGLFLAGCGSEVITRTRVETASIPVSSPCVISRPTAVVSLRDKITAVEWQAKTPKQKAALIGSQALAHQSYAQALHSATAGCPEIAE